MKKSLAEILEFTNNDIIHRYEQDYLLNHLRGDEALSELIKFLWLSKKHEGDKLLSPNDNKLKFVCGIPEELDDMWHTFILFTKDYAEFCAENFGHFIHHAPTSESERLTVDLSQSNFSLYFDYVKENLGEETTSKWFQIALA
ncbi:MAG: hypothetical protein H0U70_12905 [Tatlockia sp.]|nr:hypothetical protein [Tatlockia sp.]